MRIGDVYRSDFCEITITSKKTINNIEHIIYKGFYFINTRSSFNDAQASVNGFTNLLKNNGYSLVNEDEEML
jgi:hypothetical protein